jgi:aspartyl-tRNA(Asn)/glutamyl-tRNA(Gln) amidotransferase subunit B
VVERTMSAPQPRSKLIEGSKGPWEVVIGMEVHAQVSSRSKLFSGASTEFGAKPNSQVSLVDAAMPGMLPVINRFCVEQAVKTGLGLKAQINLRSVFDRKNYFFPDLPPGYQISQYKQPIVGEGELLVDIPEGEPVRVGIERLHLEQDAGKSLHDQHPDYTYVDLNRAGVALMEIVSKPDLRSAEEAAEFLRKLRSILRYLGTCDGNMEEGSMRADVNVSVRKPGARLGTRCEIKNINSMRFIIQAVEFEARRQIDVLESGGSITQETRRFDSRSGETRSMRSKEEAPDYRYFPDPDLLPLVLDQAWVDEIKRNLPELPDEKKSRYLKDFQLPAYQAGVLVADKDLATQFEHSLGPTFTAAQVQQSANLYINDVLGHLSRTRIPIGENPLTPRSVGAIVTMMSSGTISPTVSKAVIKEIIEQRGGDPVAIVEEKGLKQVTDEAAIERAVDSVIAANPQKADEARAKPKMASWFVGQVMKATGGKANPQSVTAILKRRLGLPDEG